MTEKMEHPLSTQEKEIDSDDISSNPTDTPSLGDIVNARVNRRGALKGMLATAVVGAVGTTQLAKTSQAASKSLNGRIDPETGSTLTFKELEHKIDENDGVAEGYNADVLIRWGDKVVPDAPEFDPQRLTVRGQAKQFGYNNDFLGYMPLPLGSANSEHGLLCVNHEYTNAHLMWRGVNSSMDLNKERVNIEMLAHGHSVIEVRKAFGKWQVVEDSKYARRLTLFSKMKIAGPAAGYNRLKTSEDPTGRTAMGTVNNCAGGVTPWGTVLIAEENFHGYFGGDVDKAAVSDAEKASWKRLGVGKPRYAWYKYYDRFDVAKEPMEPNRFGWMVELDPYNPDAVPVKRTALGRFKHEGAQTTVNEDGHVVVYSGDDQRFDYLYRFVTKGKYNPNDREANMNLLDEGTLSVAKFNADGSLDWLPLVYGEGPLTSTNKFHNQADVVIDARIAADLLGATPMDRPEDVEVNPVTGKVYVALTNNTKRKPEQVDAANPRANNKYGSVVEIIPNNGDHTAAQSTWNIFLQAGNPMIPGHQAKYHPGVSQNGWLAAPDNVSFDRFGRLWISTDQGSAQRKNNIPDGMYGTDTEGFGRALTRFFYRCPADAEMCGPVFTPDSKTLFVAVQHPSETKGATFDNPSTRWPDFDANTPPRPSVVAITKKDGGEIGS